MPEYIILQFYRLKHPNICTHTYIDTSLCRIRLLSRMDLISGVFILLHLAHVYYCVSLITTALWYVLKSGIMTPSNLLLLIESLLAIQDSCVSIWKLGSFTMDLKSMPLLIGLNPTETVNLSNDYGQFYDAVSSNPWI